MIGLCKSGFRDDMGYIAAVITNLIAWRAEFGARSVLYAAATEDVTPGAYISYCREDPPYTYLYTAEGREVQDKMWRECLDLWAQVDSSVSEIGQKD